MLKYSCLTRIIHERHYKRQRVVQVGIWIPVVRAGGEVERKNRGVPRSRQSNLQEGQTGVPRPLPVLISVEFVTAKISRWRRRGPEPHDGKLVRTGRKSAGGRRRVEPRPKPERLTSAVVPATFQLEPERKRYQPPASATPPSEHTQRR